MGWTVLERKGRGERGFARMMDSGRWTESEQKTQKDSETKRGTGNGKTGVRFDAATPKRSEM